MRDDSLVIAALLEETILPAYRRANSGTNAPLTIINETPPQCLNRPTGETRCHIPDQWRRFLEPDAARNWAGTPCRRTSSQGTHNLAGNEKYRIASSTSFFASRHCAVRLAQRLASRSAGLALPAEDRVSVRLAAWLFDRWARSRVWQFFVRQSLRIWLVIRTRARWQSEAGEIGDRYRDQLMVGVPPDTPLQPTSGRNSGA